MISKTNTDDTAGTAAECEDCVALPAGSAQSDGTSLLCVRCPFCHQTVSAILTPTSITCPKCETTVKK